MAATPNHGGHVHSPGTGSAGGDLIVEATDLELRYGSFVAIASSTFRSPGSAWCR